MNPMLYRVAKLLSRPLPKPLFYRLAHGYARREYHAFLRRRLGIYFNPVDPGSPVAPREIMLTTRTMSEDALRAHMLPDRYHAASYRTVHSWLATIERFGFNLRTCGAVLELGCGSGRLIRHFRCIEGLRIVGCDIDARCIEWCRQNIPGVEFYCNELRPPLAFAADNSFDFVFAASVFTHIPLEWQKAWIEEIRRVLRAGGFFIGTVEGWYHQQRQLTPENRARLCAEGELMLTKEDPNASLSTKVLNSWDVFQTRSRLIEAFGSVLWLCDFQSDVQDALILQKPR
jgi:SAM-dependent methyltransferase